MRLSLHGCDRILDETRNTPLYRLKKPIEVGTMMLTLLGHGCPLQARVAAFGHVERTGNRLAESSWCGLTILIGERLCGPRGREAGRVGVVRGRIGYRASPFEGVRARNLPEAGPEFLT
jgi:hypothetical protein